MRPIGIGLIAALALAVMAPATAASAAPKQDPKAALMAQKAKEKGMAEAPAIAKAAGLYCNVTDARWMGEDKKQAMNIYEVACQQGLGFVVITKAEEPKPVAYSCLETMKPTPDGARNSLFCELPANANPVTGLAPYVAKAGRTCVPEKARGVGQGQKNAYFEVLCQGGQGFIIVTSAPPNADEPVQMNTCLVYEPGGNLFCELTDRATQLQAIDALVVKSGKSCTVSDRRYVLSTKDGANYYEVACQGGSGYMVQENAKGELARILDCGSADFVGGGCTLTDARSAQTEQAALYTRLAGKAGFPCEVSKYAPLPTTGAQEVIELQCSNRDDGGIGVFTAQGGRIMDCVHAEIEGYRCSFSKKEAVFPKLTGNLKSMGKTSCVVSDARAIGKTANEGFVEVACADGLPGWVLGFPLGSTSPKEVLSCTQAANIGGGCKLSTNRRG